MKQHLQPNRVMNVSLRDRGGYTFGVFATIEAAVAEAEALGLRGYITAPTDKPVNDGDVWF